jgi:hypothetical protein
VETRNRSFTAPRRGANPGRSRVRRLDLEGPRGLARSRPAAGILGLLLWQAIALGVIAVSIALDGILRPSPGVELAWQIGAFVVAIFLSERGFARFVPDIDRRWRIRRKMF